MERGRLREALRHVLGAARLGNQHMQAAQPWALLKAGEADRCASVKGQWGNSLFYIFTAYRSIESYFFQQQT